MKFRDRYNLARLGVAVLFLGVVAASVAIDIAFFYWILIAAAAAVLGWLLTQRAIACPHCGQPVAGPDSEGEIPFPLLGRTPTTCARCGGNLD